MTRSAPHDDADVNQRLAVDHAWRVRCKHVTCKNNATKEYEWLEEAKSEATCVRANNAT